MGTCEAPSSCENRKAFGPVPVVDIFGIDQHHSRLTTSAGEIQPCKGNRVLHCPINLATSLGTTPSPYFEEGASLVPGKSAWGRLTA